MGRAGMSPQQWQRVVAGPSGCSVELCCAVNTASHSRQSRLGQSFPEMTRSRVHSSR